MKIREDITKNTNKSSVADSSYISHIVISLKKIINIHKLTAVLYNRNETKMIGSL